MPVIKCAVYSLLLFFLRSISSGLPAFNSGDTEKPKINVNDLFQIARENQVTIL